MENHVNIRRVFLYILIASVAASALIGIGVFIFGDFGRIELRIMMTTLTVTATSILGLACGAYLESGRGRILPLVGIAFAILAAIMTFLIVWDVYDDSEVFLKTTVSVTLLALSCSLLSLLSLARLDRRFAWSRLVAFVSVSLLSVILLYLMWFEPTGDSDLVFRVIGVLSIVIASITIITPIFHNLSTDETDIEKIDAEIATLVERIAELEKKRGTLAQPAGAE
jgi:hypothetical protein